MLSKNPDTAFPAGFRLRYSTGLGIIETPLASPVLAREVTVRCGSENDSPHTARCSVGAEMTVGGKYREGSRLCGPAGGVLNSRELGLIAQLMDRERRRLNCNALLQSKGTVLVSR
jgi:hypothetical protein